MTITRLAPEKTLECSKNADMKAWRMGMSLLKPASRCVRIAEAPSTSVMMVVTTAMVLRQEINPWAMRAISASVRVAAWGVLIGQLRWKRGCCCRQQPVEQQVQARTLQQVQVLEQVGALQGVQMLGQVRALQQVQLLGQGL